MIQYQVEGILQYTLRHFSIVMFWSFVMSYSFFLFVVEPAMLLQSSQFNLSWSIRHMGLLPFLWD